MYREHEECEGEGGNPAWFLPAREQELGVVEVEQVESSGVWVCVFFVFFLARGVTVVSGSGL